MRFTIAVPIFALLASASASNLTGRQSLPNCAATCLANADLGGCGSSDNKCLCNSSAFVSSTSACIESKCTGSDLAAAEKAAQEICLSVGVTLTATATSTSSSPTPTTPSSNRPSTSNGTASASSSAAAATKSPSSALSNGATALAGAAAAALVGLTVVF